MTLHLSLLTLKTEEGDHDPRVQQFLEVGNEPLLTLKQEYRDLYQTSNLQLTKGNIVRYEGKIVR